MPWTPIANLTGPTGPTGPQGPIGLPGVNAVANDTATAGYISSTASATYAQLVATFPTIADTDAIGSVAQGTNIAVTMTSNWGINSRGNAYHDPAGAPSGDGASAGFDAAGNLVITRILGY